MNLYRTLRVLNDAPEVADQVLTVADAIDTPSTYDGAVLLRRIARAQPGASIVTDVLSIGYARDIIDDVALYLEDNVREGDPDDADRDWLSRQVFVLLTTLGVKL